MLYLGIDQHKRQLTVNLRSEDGSVILKRQVSTEWEKVRAFFADLAERARPEGGFLAILEVCGMKPLVAGDAQGIWLPGKSSSRSPRSDRNRRPTAAMPARWATCSGFIGSSSSRESIRWACGASSHRRLKKPTIGRLRHCVRD